MAALPAWAQAPFEPAQSLARESQRQQLDLRLRQQQYQWQRAPAAPDQQAEMRRRFAEQQRQLWRLQESQRAEAARQIQRRQITPLPPGFALPGYQPGGFAREQQRLQRQLDMQRRSWRY